MLNGWPDEERKASKLQDFWDWINMISPFVTGRLALSVRDMPAGADGDTLVLEFEAGHVRPLHRSRNGVLPSRMPSSCSRALTLTGWPCSTATTSARW